MKGAWGDKLVDREVQGVSADNLTPKDIMGRIILMVEYYPPKAEGAEPVLDDSSDDSADEAEGEQAALPRKHVHHKISPALAALGHYARSMKPDKNWLTEQLSTPPHPQHILINISEPTLLKLVPTSLSSLISHAQTNLRRIYPKGTRITSHNFNPLEFWQNGSQIASLNWQHYDLGMQINEAMLIGSRGWIMKPGKITGTRDGAVRKVKFIGEVAGISSVPRPDNKDSFSAYVRAELFHSGEKQVWKSKVVKAKDVPGIAGADITWVENTNVQQFEWEYESEDLVFIRLMVIRHHEFLEHEDLAVFCAKIDHLESGWKLVRLLDMKGKHVGATVLVRFKRE
jgi:phosphatidylinositol phospholipase C delta